MDKEDPAVRQHLAQGSDLLGAIRLPNATFRANAGTDVTTDILFLQKRSFNEPARGESWTELRSLKTPNGLIPVNEYFVRHPEMMLGRMEMTSSQHGPVPALIGNLESELLKTAIGQLPASVFRTKGVEDKLRVPTDAGMDPSIMALRMGLSLRSMAES